MAYKLLTLLLSIDNDLIEMWGTKLLGLDDQVISMSI